MNHLNDPSSHKHGSGTCVFFERERSYWRRIHFSLNHVYGRKGTLPKMNECPLKMDSFKRKGFLIFQPFLRGKLAVTVVFGLIFPRCSWSNQKLPVFQPYRLCQKSWISQDLEMPKIPNVFSFSGRKDALLRKNIYSWFQNFRYFSQKFSMLSFEEESSTLPPIIIGTEKWAPPLVQ